jgi:hypothetical protein
MIPKWQIAGIIILVLLAVAAGIHGSPNSYAYAFLERPVQPCACPESLPSAQQARLLITALHALRYNFARINSAVRMPPAMATRLTEKLWNISDIVMPIEKSEAR